MNSAKITEHFDQEAFGYDELILRLIPNYLEQHDVITKLIPFERSEQLNVLDLGCGTGVLSYLILRDFPNALVNAIDLAEKMLEVCKKNLAIFANRLDLKRGNFGTEEFGQGYDIILSGLSTHHLDNPGKIDLYRRIYQGLSPGGIFINREIVLGATPNVTEYYHKLWRQFIRSNGEDDEKWFEKYLEEDIPASLENQLQWLSHAGFVDVECHWKHLNFAVFGGRKTI